MAVHPPPPAPSSPLLALPLEIRLMIYEMLLLPSSKPSSYSTTVANLPPDPYVLAQDSLVRGAAEYDPFVLNVRTISEGSIAAVTGRRRSHYWVQKGPFRTYTTPTTYRILLSPWTAHLRHTIPSLLPLSRQIHFEASKLLYSTYTFSFGTSIEALPPFLSDLTPHSRSCVRSLGITKKGLPYTKEFDRAEWANMCAYLADPQSELSLRCLELGVMCGDPGAGEEGDEVPELRREEFEVLAWLGREFSVKGGGDVDLDWVHQLMGVKGLKKLDVMALVERCMAPRSESMRFWVAFSKSVERGFADWVRAIMVD